MKAADMSASDGEFAANVRVTFLSRTATVRIQPKETLAGLKAVVAKEFGLATAFELLDSEGALVETDHNALQIAGRAAARCSSTNKSKIPELEVVADEDALDDLESASRKAVEAVSAAGAMRWSLLRDVIGRLRRQVTGNVRELSEQLAAECESREEAEKHLTSRLDGLVNRLDGVATCSEQTGQVAPESQMELFSVELSKERAAREVMEERLHDLAREIREVATAAVCDQLSCERDDREEAVEQLRSSLDKLSERVDEAADQESACAWKAELDAVRADLRAEICTELEEVEAARGLEMEESLLRLRTELSAELSAGLRAAKMVAEVQESSTGLRAAADKLQRDMDALRAASENGSDVQESDVAQGVQFLAAAPPGLRATRKRASSQAKRWLTRSPARPPSHSRDRIEAADKKLGFVSPSSPKDPYLTDDKESLKLAGGSISVFESRHEEEEEAKRPAELVRATEAQACAGHLAGEEGATADPAVAASVDDAGGAGEWGISAELASQIAASDCWENWLEEEAKKPAEEEQEEAKRPAELVGATEAQQAISAARQQAISAAVAADIQAKADPAETARISAAVAAATTAATTTAAATTAAAELARAQAARERARISAAVAAATAARERARVAEAVSANAARGSKVAVVEGPAVATVSLRAAGAQASTQGLVSRPDLSKADDVAAAIASVEANVTLADFRANHMPPPVQEDKAAKKKAAKKKGR